MKSLMVAAVALVALTAGDAWAFDNSREPGALLYFTLPFGAQTKQEAAPKIGFRIGITGDSYQTSSSGYDPFSAFDAAPVRVRVSLFDFGVRLDDTMTFNLKGMDIGQSGSALYADDGEDFFMGVATPLAVTAGFIGLFVLVKQVN